MSNCIMRTRNGFCFADITLLRVWQLVSEIDSVGRPIGRVQLDFGKDGKRHVTLWVKRRVPAKPLWIDLDLVDGTPISAYDFLLLECPGPTQP